MKSEMKELFCYWKDFLLILIGATILTAVLMIIGAALTAMLFSAWDWLSGSPDAPMCGIVNQGQTP